jgi:hypothetical protein
MHAYRETLLWAWEANPEIEEILPRAEERAPQENERCHRFKRSCGLNAYPVFAIGAIAGELPILETLTPDVHKGA